MVISLESRPKAKQDIIKTKISFTICEVLPIVYILIG